MSATSVSREIFSPAVPLAVDLDGTLIAGDSLLESILLLVKNRPGCLLLLRVWLFRGRATLKSEIAKRITLRVETLPYRQDVISYL
jgi:hypothetical protein